MCALVTAVYAYSAHSGYFELLSLNPADTYYNLLVQGFRAGQLSLKKDVPPGFARLADPYDPIANAVYRHQAYPFHDLSYYKGRVYLYFGVTPALILFWPFVALTGHYLFHKQAVVIFCAVGFLVSAGLLRALWRRYFAEVSVGVMAACAIALGLATSVPVLLSRCDVYEVPISCGYMLAMLALGAVWCALHKPERGWQWLVAASLAYGLALGARPTLLLGAAILLVPVIRAWRERRRLWPLLIAAAGPILLIGLGVMLYNALRFDSPFEFGVRYQLAVTRQVAQQFLGVHFLWSNFWAYFLEPAHWDGHFPFVHGMDVPSLPSEPVLGEVPFGILINNPVAWLALAAPLAFRNRSGLVGSTLRWFVTTVALLFGLCAVNVSLFRAPNFRYEVDFLPALVLLAVIGILSLERALSPSSGSGLADRPVWRSVARCGWSLLLGFSVIFNLLAGVEHYAESDNNLGAALEKTGRVQEAIVQYERALRLKPDFAEAHYNLGLVLWQTGNAKAAIGEFEEAVRIDPDLAEAQNNLAVALVQQGRLQEAAEHFEQALRVAPDDAETYYNLGGVFLRLGRLPAAVAQWEQAVRINPDLAEAHYNLAVALEQTGKIEDAIRHYERVLQLEPDYAEAQKALARLRTAQ